MEPERNEDQTTRDRQATERSAPKTGNDAFTTPFASEGLERVRDSHC